MNASINSVPLGKIADVIRGISYSAGEAVEAPQPGYVPVLRAGNIQNELKLDVGLVWVPAERMSEVQRIRSGDIVMCTSSGSADVVGKTARAWNDWEGSYGAFCAGIRVRSKVADAAYLHHFLGSPTFKAWTLRSAGANIKNIRKSELEEFSVPLPPLTEQKRIAAILDKADTIRRKRQQAIQLADEFLRSVFLDMFGDPLTNPKDWPTGTIDDVAILERGSIRCGPFGTQLKVDELVPEGIPLLGIENVADGRFVDRYSKFLTPEKADELHAFSVIPGDVLITRMGTIGKACVVPPGMGEARISYHLFRIRVDKSKCLPEFLAATITHSGTFMHQLNRRAHGAIMAGLNTMMLREVQFLIPEIEHQRKYLKTVQAMLSISNKSKKATEDTNALFEGLSQRAFRGEL